MFSAWALWSKTHESRSSRFEWRHRPDLHPVGVRAILEAAEH
jgi:hypothetical protein